MRLGGAWQENQTVDLRALAAGRVALGLYLLVDLAERVRLAPALYAAEGCFPLDAQPEHPLRALALVIRGGEGLVSTQGLFVVAGAAYVLLTLGLWSRAAAVASLVSLCLLRDLNPILGFGIDTVATLSLWAFVFLPVGARGSVDAAWRARAAPSGATPPPLVVLSPAIVLLVVQHAYLYGFTGLMKGQHAAWRNGEALSLVLGAEHTVTAFGQWVSTWPAPLLALLTWAVLAADVVIPVLLVLPARGRFTGLLSPRFLGITALVAMHVGINLCMRVGLFGLVSVIALVPLVPPDVVDRALIVLKRPTAPRVVEDRRSPVVLVVVVVFLAAAAVWNACWIGKPRHAELPAPFVAAVRALHLDQNWGMFSVLEDRATRWWSVRVVDDSGTRDIAGGPEVPLLDVRFPTELAGVRWIYWLNALRDESDPAGRELRRAATVRFLARAEGARLVEHEWPVVARGERPPRREKVLWPR